MGAMKDLSIQAMELGERHKGEGRQPLKTDDEVAEELGVKWPGLLEWYWLGYKAGPTLAELPDRLPETPPETG